MPPAFLETDWNSSQRSYLLPSCLTGHTKCDAVLTDLDGDGIAEIILLPSLLGQASVFRSNDDHAWSYLGSLAGANCTGMPDALRAGSFEVAQPTFKELEISGHRLRLIVPAECSPYTVITGAKH